MIARARSRCDLPWTAWVVVIAVGATASAFASASIADALVADARIAHGQPWRALTGPFVHATWGHLVRDLALVAIAGAGYEAALRSRRGLVFAGGLVLPAIAVLAAGDARWYCGLSGLSHALLAAALSYELVSRRGMARAVVLALGAVGALKPVYELATGSPAFAMSLGPGVAQVPLAHVVGALVGIAAGLLAGFDRRAAVHRTNLGGGAAGTHLAASGPLHQARTLYNGANGRWWGSPSPSQQGGHRAEKRRQGCRGTQAAADAHRAWVRSAALGHRRRSRYRDGRRDRPLPARPRRADR